VDSSNLKKEKRGIIKGGGLVFAPGQSLLSGKGSGTLRLEEMRYLKNGGLPKWEDVEWGEDPRGSVEHHI